MPRTQPTTQGTYQASGGAIPREAWYADASDWSGLTVSESLDVLDAISGAVDRLWRAVEAARSF